MDKNNVALKKTPNNLEAEQSVLGAVMIDGELCKDIVAKVRKEDFYFEIHQIIFECMRRLSALSVAVDMVTVADALEKEGNLGKIGGINYLSDLVSLIPSTANVNYYLSIIKRDSKLRDLINAANKVIEDCYTSQDEKLAMARAEKAMFDVTFTTENKDLIPISDGTLASMKMIEEMLVNGRGATGVETGFSNLDRIIHGYQPGQMIVLAARPGCGKTSFAMNVVANVALAHKEMVVAVFNLEMSVEELSKRMLLSVARVASDTLVNHNSADLFHKLWSVHDQLASTKIFVDDSTGASPEVIMSKLRRLKQRQKRLDFVVIDYLQLLRSATSTKDSFQVQMADISRSIKIMAKELKVPILILSQTSRDLEKRDDKTPKLSDLRDSGAIEQDADQVYFLTKDEKQENEEFEVVDLNILKHRSGSTGKIHLKWQGDIVRFTALDGYKREINNGSEPEYAKPLPLNTIEEPISTVVVSDTTTFAVEGGRVNSDNDDALKTVIKSYSENDNTQQKSGVNEGSVVAVSHEEQAVVNGILGKEYSAGDIIDVILATNAPIKDMPEDIE